MQIRGSGQAYDVTTVDAVGHTVATAVILGYKEKSVDEPSM